MKSGRLFWGVFFVLVGLLFLFRHLLPPLMGAEVLWRLWPVVIILIGLAILLRDHPLRIVLVVLSALLLALLAGGLFGLIREGTCDDVVSSGETKDFSVPLRPETRAASLSLDLGAARVFVGGRTEQLLEASTVTAVGEYELSHVVSDSSDDLALAFRGEKVHWRPWKLANRADVRIHSGPVWDMNLDCGAARLEMDLRDHKVGNLDIDAGASSIDLTLGRGVPETRVSIDAGASSVAIEVPSESGCEVRIEGGLTSKKLSDFEKVGKQLWRTANYDDAAEKIVIDVNAGVSRIKVRRY